LNQYATSIFRVEEEAERGENSTGIGWVWEPVGIRIFKSEFSLLPT
jgi:hypothetical protein